MYIDVRIPWEPGKQLGKACNRMFRTVEDWGLILDWDVHLLNTNWYDICLNAINRVGNNAGLISCLTNRIAFAPQRYESEINDSDDIASHGLLSSTIQRDNSGKIEDITSHPHWLSGMFFLTRRKVWDEVGGVPDDIFLGMDNEYHRRVKAAGYHIYIMQDLYVFHNYRRQWKSKPA
jgi:GT2 family glycosyltransferase